MHLTNTFKDELTFYLKQYTLCNAIDSSISSLDTIPITSKEQTRRSVCTDAHAGLRLCNGHTTKSGFLVKMSICNKDIVTEDINGLIICPNVQKSSDYAKKS